MVGGSQYRAQRTSHIAQGHMAHGTAEPWRAGAEVGVVVRWLVCGCVAGRREEGGRVLVRGGEVRRKSCLRGLKRACAASAPWNSTSSSCSFRRSSTNFSDSPLDLRRSPANFPKGTPNFVIFTRHTAFFLVLFSVLSCEPLTLNAERRRALSIAAGVRSGRDGVA